MKNNKLPAVSFRLTLSPAALAVQAALAVAAGATALPAAAEDELPVQRVTVVGSAEHGYETKSTSTATKTDTLLRDTPQAITVVTQELIRDQGMQGMADVVRYVPGMNMAQGEGNRDATVMRGNATTGDFFVDGIRDDVQYYRDLYNIYSVEALKGPNAMVFGRGGSGGVINRVTKEPVGTPVREATVSVGSWKARRATLDIGEPLGGNAAVRVNAMDEDAGSYRDGTDSRRKGINPTLGLNLGKDTRVVLGYEHFRDERVADRGVPGMNGKPYPTAPGAFFGSAGLSPTWVRVNAFSALVEHGFANGALLRNRTRYADYDKFYQNVFPSSQVSLAGGVETVTLGAYNNATQRTNLFNQTDLNFTVDTGAVRHKLAAGIELGRQETDNLRNTGYFAGSSKVAAASPFPAGAVTFRQSATDADNHGVATARSAYLQDQIEFSPHWQAIVGLRYDHFKVDFTNRRNGQRLDITDSPVSPRVGLVYKPVPEVSVYASYSRAYAPRAGEQLASLSPSNAAFDPEEFTNVELGAKWDLLPALSASAAVYQLDRTNVLVTDPADPARSYLADGQRSRGLELGLQGNITRAWSVMGAYAWQDAALTAPKPAVVANVPRHMLSLWNRYDFTRAFGAGLGLIHRGEVFASASNAVTLPGYTRVDAALYYHIGRDYRVQLNVENLFDKRYYASAHSDSNIMPGSPRAARLTLSARF